MKNMMTALALLITFSPEVFARSGQKAIYGSFDNEFVTHASSSNIKELATGVALLVPKKLIKKNGNNNATILARPLKQMSNLCSNEKFANNLVSAPGCTGFLVGSDILVTAGHCLKDLGGCSNFSAAFGVSSAKEAKDEGGFYVPQASIYSCKRVLRAYDTEETNYDFAVIQLDREPSARYKFRLGNDEDLTTKSSVYMLGHPLGLAVTYSKPGPVVGTWDPKVLRIQIDSFGGNSGSPVINAATNEVVGILTGGQDDFENGKSCRKYARYSSGSEGATRISLIKDFIEEYNDYN